MCLRTRGWSGLFSDVPFSSSAHSVCLKFICCLKTSSGNCEQLSPCLFQDCKFLGKKGSNVGEARECWAGLFPAGQPNCSLGIPSKAELSPSIRAEISIVATGQAQQVRDKQKGVVRVEEDEDFSSLEKELSSLETIDGDYPHGIASCTGQGSVHTLGTEV